MGQRCLVFPKNQPLLPCHRTVAGAQQEDTKSQPLVLSVATWTVPLGRMWGNTLDPILGWEEILGPLSSLNLKSMRTIPGRMRPTEKTTHLPQDHTENSFSPVLPDGMVTDPLKPTAHFQQLTYSAWQPGSNLQTFTLRTNLQSKQKH
jgi:hypothetical protein